MTETQNWYPYPLPDPPPVAPVLSSNVGSGSGAPDAGSGSDGDIWIRDNGSVYRKVAGVWTLLYTSAGGTAITQTYEYTTTDPTTDAITPDDQNSAAMAYKRDGTGPIYFWDTVAHTWS